VTAVDWAILAFCALLALYGYLQGFIVGVLSLAGFAAGAFAGARLGPLLLPGGAHSRFAPLFGLLGALLAGGVLASGLEGLGAHARAALRLPGLRAVDGLLGGLLTGCVGLGIAWIVGAVAAQSADSPTLRADIQRSAILRGLNELLPPSGPLLHALARFDPLPSVTGPAAAVPAPNPAILRMTGVRQAAASVVRVLGTACGLVVTNAHVVAGESDTTVEVGGNPPNLSAELVDFDPRDDIAVLRVAALDRPPLPLAPVSTAGTPVAILGYPLNGPLDAEPGRIGQTQVVSTEDAYGNGPVLRSVTPLRGLVRPGNSGGPLIDPAGRVAGTVFAAITGGQGAAGPGGFAVPDTLVRAQLLRAERAPGPVGSGACAG
jgi:hypothetical protein